MKRNLIKIDAEGNETTHTFDVVWEEVFDMRKALLLETDLWYLKDRWDSLSSTNKGKLNTLRQTLRDLPQTYDNPNDAFDNFPTAEDWMVPDWQFKERSE